MLINMDDIIANSILSHSHYNVYEPRVLYRWRDKWIWIYLDTYGTYGFSDEVAELLARLEKECAAQISRPLDFYIVEDELYCVQLKCPLGLVPFYRWMGRLKAVCFKIQLARDPVAESNQREMLLSLNSARHYPMSIEVCDVIWGIVAVYSAESTVPLLRDLAKK